MRYSGYQVGYFVWGRFAPWTHSLDGLCLCVELVSVFLCSVGDRPPLGVAGGRGWSCPLLPPQVLPRPNPLRDCNTSVSGGRLQNVAVPKPLLLPLLSFFPLFLPVIKHLIFSPSLSPSLPPSLPPTFPPSLPSQGPSYLLHSTLLRTTLALQILLCWRH